MTDCPICEGTYALPDDTLCVCVTPDSVRERDWALSQAERQAGDAEELRETIKAQRDTIADCWSKLSCADGDDDALAGAIEKELDETAANDEVNEALASAADALRSYLVSVGYASNPVTLPPGPLRDLADALL